MISWLSALLASSRVPYELLALVLTIYSLVKKGSQVVDLHFCIKKNSNILFVNTESP